MEVYILIIITVASSSYELDILGSLYYILRSNMGQSQPKKITRVTKPQIDIACLKARIHLELVRDRKNQEVIKGEK